MAETPLGSQIAVVGGQLVARGTTAAEIKIAIKELRLLKKEEQAKKRELMAELRQLRADYRSKTAHRMPLTRGGWLRDHPWILLIAAVATVDGVMWVLGLQTGFYVPGLGIDLATYRDATARWLAGGSWFQPYQSAPYDIFTAQPQPILYPPTTIPLFAAFTVLPAILWWAIPIAVTLACLAAHHPRREAWVVIGLLMAWPSSLIALQTGNPAMWVVMSLALATHRPGFGPWVLLKPTLAPFALAGVRSRWWWTGLGLLALASLPFLPLWLAYVGVLLNQRGADLAYSLWQVPLMFVPLVARVPAAPGLGGRPSTEYSGTSRT